MPDFEELDFQRTPIGDLVLRRRAEPRLGGQVVHEVKLGDEFLMSSLFTRGEQALAERALARCAGDALEVAVGGLGLGYTAAAALEEARVASLLVIEALGAVIGWHRRALVPLGERLCADARCRIVEGDFFALVAGGAGLDPAAPGRRFDAVLLDIDHSPEHWLSPAHAGFYRPAGLARLRGRLRAGGVFALWSNEAPDAGFVARLEEVFGEAGAEVVEFDNPYTGTRAANTVYLAVSR